MKDFLHLKINPWGLLLAAGAAAGAVTIASFLGAWWWVCEIASNYQWQCAITLTAISLICLGGRKFAAGLIFLALAAVNWVEICPLFVAAAEVRYRPESPRIRCVLLNVQSDRVRPALVHDFILATHPDVIVLMEVGDAWDKISDCLGHDYTNAITAPRDDGFGVALFSRLPMRNAQPLYGGRELVPTVYAQVRCGDHQLLVLGTHFLPPASSEDHLSRVDQLSSLVENFSDPKNTRMIVLGDLNVTHWSPYFKEFVKKGRLLDSARGFGVQATWPVNGFPMRIPIDHCLISPSFKVINRTLGPSVGSDHFPLIVDLAVGD